MTHHPDPDPRHVPEDELWDPAAAAWVPRPSVLWALLVGALAGAVLGFFVAVVVVHAAAPRPSQEVGSPTLIPARTGAPPVVDDATAGRHDPTSRSVASGPLGGAPTLPSAESLARTSQSVAGTATWYVDHSKPIDGLYGAVPGWHYGDQPYLLRVTAGSRSVVILIGDCLCGGIAGRVVDLSPSAFARLAPLAAGVVRVTVVRVAVGPESPPPTDVR
jgi:hypothetical protein